MNGKNTLGPRTTEKSGWAQMHSMEVDVILVGSTFYC